MFEIKIIATGSKGNAYLIRDQGKHILIDPGIPIKQIRAGAAGVNLANLDFALVSHEHKDHSKAVPDLLRLAVPCLMSAGTAGALALEGMPILVLKDSAVTALSGWMILPFAVQHDAAEPLGFLIMTPGGKKILYATDTYYIKYRFAGVTHWMVEANYAEDLLEKNTALDGSIKRRIRQSHFEIGDVQEFFKSQDLTRSERIYLLHMSDGNSDASLFCDAIKKITGLPVYAG
jgi:phosphoribosyl 1,2-cyclic phosphodiesterase